MMIRNNFGEKSFLVKKIFFWLGFQAKILHHNEHVSDKLRQKLEKSRSGRLKYSSEVVRSLGRRFFDPKYHLEVISWPYVQIISTQTKKLCPHIFARFGSRVFICEYPLTCFKVHPMPLCALKAHPMHLRVSSKIIFFVEELVRHMITTRGLMGNGWRLHLKDQFASLKS